MMNFNPQETMTLTNLLAALQGGMDPSQSYDVLNQVLQTQMQRAQTRKQTMADMAAALEGTAQMYPNRSAAMTQVNAWDQAGIAGPHMADTLRQTVKTLYPEGAGTPSPMFDYSALSSSTGSTDATAMPSAPSMPSPSEQTDFRAMYNDPNLPTYTPEWDAVTPNRFSQRANNIAMQLATRGIVPTGAEIYQILSQDPSYQRWVAQWPKQAQYLSELAASNVSRATLSSLQAQTP